MDGLPGLRRAVETARREHIEPIKKMVGPYAPSAARKKLNRSPMTLLVSVAASSFVLGVVMTWLILVYIRADALRSISL